MTRRAVPPLDPDPRYVEPEPVRRAETDAERAVGRLQRVGTAVLWIVFAVLIAAIVATVFALTRATPRPGQTTDPVDVSGTSSAAQGPAPRLGRGAGLPVPARSSLAGEPIPALATVTRGWATWYEDPRKSGPYAAAPWWRFGMDPEWVSVCAFDGGRSSCTNALVTDHCACGPRHGIPTVIDLAPSVFVDLAPLSQGVVRVQVDRGTRAPTAPATDVLP